MFLHYPSFLKGFINAGPTFGFPFTFPCKAAAPLYQSSTPTRTAPVYYTSATASTRGLIYYFLVSVFIIVNALSIFNIVILCLLFKSTSRQTVTTILSDAPPIGAIMMLYNISKSIFNSFMSDLKASTVTYKIVLALGLLSGSKWIITGVLLVVGLNPFMPSKKSVRKYVASCTFVRPLVYFFSPPAISEPVEFKADPAEMPVTKRRVKILKKCLYQGQLRPGRPIILPFGRPLSSRVILRPATDRSCTSLAICFIIGCLLPIIYSTSSAEAGPVSLRFEEVSSIFLPAILREGELVCMLLFPIDALLAILSRKVDMIGSKINIVGPGRSCHPLMPDEAGSPPEQKVSNSMARISPAKKRRAKKST